MFTIYLPAVGEGVASSRRLNSFPANTEGSELVLLVDDEKQLREILGSILQTKGYRVLQAEDALSALDIIEKQATPIDLLVTDILMPGMSGAALAKQLNRTRDLTRAVFISGYAENFLQHDLDGFPEAIVLQKPFSAETFLQSVRMLLERKPQ